MAGYSARQSSFTTGDTILAAHSNDEFNQVLAAFHATTGHSHDGTAGEGGPISTLRDADSNNKILVDSTNNHLEFYVEVSSSAVEQIKVQDGAIVPVTDNDIDLGTSSLEFKDAFFDGTITTDALVADTADLNGGSVDGATLGTNSAITQAVIDNININGATIGHTDDTDLLTLANGVLTVAGEVSMTTLDIGGTNVTSTAAELNILDGVTSTAAELNLVDGITAGTVSASKAVIVDSNKDISGFRNLSITGDLTVSGDDITMGTNTAGNLLIADGTNFNSIAVGSLSEISTIASDDVFLAVDTSGGGLKKVARSTVVSGLATSAALNNIVEDTSPQLGGDLDTNSANILIDDAHFIADENGNEQIIFQTTSSAVNQFDVTNAATGNAPKLSATGGDSNIDLEIEAKGTGHVTVRGNTNAGAIQFNCESNSHGQILKSQPHSAAVTNVMLLPDGADSTLVSLVATQTLTNKTLTTPVIAEIDSGSTITLDATTDIILDADGGDIIFKDGGTSIATLTNSSTDFIIESATSDKDIIFKVNDGGSSTEVARFDGDVSALLMASGKKIMLGAAEETISGDGTDITFEVGSNGDINIPANIGLTFGDDGEKIEGDGTDLTISANNLTVDAAADIILDAGGNDFNFKAGGTEVLRISNSSSDVIIKPIVDAKDLIFQQRDGTEVARIEDNGTFNVVTDKLAINGTAVTSTAAELNKLDGAGTLKQAGKETIWVPAVAMYPNSTNGCAAIAQTELSNGPEIKTLDFDKDADEKAQFAVAFPKSWNEGTVTFQAFFTADTTNTGTVSWSLSGVAIADNDSTNTAFGTGVAPTAKAHSGTANDLDVTAESGAVTIAGSPSTDEQVFFEIVRDVSADSLTADAKLLGIKLFFTTDAANDA